MPEPPHDPGVDPDDDQDMAYANDHDQEVGGERHAPHAGAPVLPFARRGRPNTRYRMELRDQLSALIVEAGIRHTHYRDIQVDDRLIKIWRGMPRDMYNLMRHVIGATADVTRLTRIVKCYRCGRDVEGGGKSTSSDSSSHDRSPRAASNEHEPPLKSNNNHHGDEAVPSVTSSQQPAASISSHDHEQGTGPSIV